jgi:hypothetical protein
MARELKIYNAKDGNSSNVGLTLDPLGNTLSYKSYEGSLTTDTTLDINTDLGRFGSAGYFTNDDSTNSVGIQFSLDGTTFGDTITVKAVEIFEFNNWVVFKQIKLIHTNNIAYRMVVR